MKSKLKPMFITVAVLTLVNCACNRNVEVALGTPSKKKIENFGGFILKGGRGSPQKPNFCIPLIWDILVRREGVKT